MSKKMMYGVLAALVVAAAAAMPAMAQDDGIKAAVAREDALNLNAKPLIDGPNTNDSSEPGNFDVGGNLTVGGNVGIGTLTPAQRMHMYTPSTASTRFRLENTQGAVDMLTFGGSLGMITGGNINLRLMSTGLLGLGTTSPQQTLHINRDTTASVRFRLENDEGFVDFLTDNGAMGLMTGGSSRLYITSTGNVGIGTLAPSTKLHVNGETTTSVLNITGGADLSEHFDIQSEHEITPGMVVSINPTNPGQLQVCSKAYDHSVAGVVSGAGGVNPGMIMGHQGTLADGEHPVALTGRVYVLVDAADHAITPGDMLTTSSTPGHAMKVADYDMAKGAIIGKAMTPLAQGEKGLVLVLVTLQ